MLKGSTQLNVEACGLLISARGADRVGLNIWPADSKILARRMRQSGGYLHLNSNLINAKQLRSTRTSWQRLVLFPGFLSSQAN